MDHLAQSYGNFGSEEYALEALSRKFADRGLAAKARSTSSDSNTQRNTAAGRQMSYAQSNVGHVLTLDEFTQSYRARTMVRAAKTTPQNVYRTEQTHRPQQSQTPKQPARTQTVRYGETSMRAKNVAPKAVNRKKSAAPSNRQVMTVQTPKNNVRRAVEKRTDKNDSVMIRNFRNLPVSILTAVVTCAMSLMLIVGTSVMMNGASNQYSDLQGEIATLAKQQNELQTALDIKNDLRMIEDIAVNKLGMVNKDLVTRQYIKLNDEDMIESFDSTEKNVGLSALLSAIGGGK